MLNFLKRSFKQTNKILLLLCLALSGVGILAVSSATHATTDGTAFFSRDARTMLIAVALGVFMALVISFIDYDLILKIWPLVALVGVLLMLLLIPFGKAPNARTDARSWFKITSTLYFQPSEIVKIGFVITFASHCNLVRENISSLKNVLLLCFHAAVYIGLVVITGDMGSALIFAIMFAAMIFASGVKWVYFPVGFLLVCAVLPVVWFKVFGAIQRNRILALFYPDLYPNEIYQQNLAMKAIKNGGLFGRGLFGGAYTQSGIVPESQNDMIFSVICEEFGLVGAAVLMLLFALLIIRIVRIGGKSGSYPAQIVGIGIASMIGAQAVVNIGMCTSLLPVIGITLPFISAGGSSSLCIYLAIGVVLSVSRFSKDTPLVENIPIRRMTGFK